MTVFAARQAASPLRGAPNFRDVGGWRALDGRHVRHGRVYRSGQLGELHEEDVAAVRARFPDGVRVVDLRGREESAAAAACAWPGAEIVALPVEPTVARELIAFESSGQRLTAAIARERMAAAYERFVRNAASPVGHLLRLLLEDDGRAVVIHCASGKDRTGFACAMLLEALGVARTDVLADYAHSRLRLPPKRAGRFPPDVMEVLGSVEPAYLQAAFARIEREWGTVGRYLEDEVGLTGHDREWLRAKLLA